MLKRKLRSRRGFTLAEALVTLAVLAMVVVSVTSTMAAASRVYGDSIAYSESNILCSTLSATIAGELKYAYDIAVEDGETVIFDSHSHGTGARLFIENGKLKLQTQTGTEYPLLSDSAYEGFLAAVSFEIVPDGVKTTVTVNEDGGERAKSEFTIVPINE